MPHVLEVFSEATDTRDVGRLVHLILDVSDAAHREVFIGGDGPPE
jgi:hypothetical protein